MSKITVVLKTAQGSFQLEKGEYTLDANGRLPLKKIMEDWNVKDLVWIEMEEEIKLQSDGYSDMSFSFAAGKTVELSGKVLKKDDNIEKMAQPVATKKAEKITVEASGDYNSRTEKSEEARLLKSLNKGVKNGAKTDETTDSSNAKQKQQEEEAKRVAEAKRKAEWAAKRDAEEKARKEKIEKAKKEEEEKAKKLAADKKIQEEKVKKENEEKAKKLAADKKAAEEKAKKESEEKAKQSANEKKPIQKTNNESLSLAERKAKAEEDRLLKSMNRRGPSGGGSIFGKKSANKPVNKPVSTQPKQTPVSAAPKPTSQTAQKPVTGPTPAKQPANHYATAPSAVATDIYNHAKVLFAGEGHSHGTVASLTQATLDAAESLDIDEFSKCIKNLYETVAATKQTVLITQARATVRVAQDLAVNAELTCENPDNAAAVDKYSDANETLAKLFADFKQ